MGNPGIAASDKMQGSRVQPGCPVCAATKIAFARKDEEPPHLVVLCRYRRCENCGHVFQPVSSFSNALMQVLLGGGGVVAFAFFFIQSPTIMNGIFAGISSIYGVRLLLPGLKTLFCLRESRTETE